MIELITTSLKYTHSKCQENDKVLEIYHMNADLRVFEDSRVSILVSLKRCNVHYK